jgi:hypothetical protein
MASHREIIDSIRHDRPHATPLFLESDRLAPTPDLEKNDNIGNNGSSNNNSNNNNNNNNDDPNQSKVSIHDGESAPVPDKIPLRERLHHFTFAWYTLT